MAYLGETIDANLVATVGADAVLARELRVAFVESAHRQWDLLGRARCDGNWRVAAQRLKGLAASFHANGLMQLADEALSAAPGDPVVVRRIGEPLAQLDPQG